MSVIAYFGGKSSNTFIEFIAKVELEALKRYLNILGA
jgi:hypothetical protein